MTKKQKTNEDRTEENLPEEKGIFSEKNAAKVKGEVHLLSCSLKVHNYHK